MSGVPEPTATVELTLFDALSAEVSFGTGWIVEGDIDLQKQEKALARVVNKWRLFAGRIQRERDSWVVKVPLGLFPSEYASYSITSSTSDKPLSAYISLPLATVSPVLPPEMYMPSFLPSSNEEYMLRSHPLVSFHIVKFALDKGSSINYSCIGLTLPHGVVDGVGAAYLCRAIVAELNGEDWEVPPLPKEGFNRNELQAELLSQDFTRRDPPPELPRPTQAKSEAAAKEVFNEEVIRAGRIVIIPSTTCRSFVEDVRKDISDSIPNYTSTGDILVAWILKTMYGDDPSPSKKIMIQSLASFRHLFASLPNIVVSPHNYLSLLPIPLIPVEYIQEKSLSDLAVLLARCRHAFCEYDASLFFKQVSGVIPMVPSSSEPLDYEPVPLVISNASQWRLIETDWSKIGAKETICGYRWLHGYNRAGKDAVQMIGRLTDGSVVLDTVLSAADAKRFEESVLKMVGKYEDRTDHTDK